MKLPDFIQRRSVAVRVLVVFALVAVVWAGVSASRSKTSSIVRAALPKDCVSRLALVDEAITRWADDHTTAELLVPPKAELEGYLADRSLLRCPDGGNYVFGTRALATSCTKHGHASFVVPEPPPPPLMERLSRALPWNHYRGPCGGRSSCIANLKQMEGAVQQWAVEARKQATDKPLPSDIFGPQLYIRACPICPDGGKYILGRVQDPPRCTVVGHTL